MIPIPVLGAVIGNVAGEVIYGICKKQAGAKAQRTIEAYTREIQELNQQLDIQLLKVVLAIQESLHRFMDLEAIAFDENVNKAFAGSINLALEVGVDESRILKTRRDIDAYFLS